MKKELLVPAGNMECLRQAVWNGCDAVYLACKNFGARKFATNFTDEEMIEAIQFCHLYGVRIYVTMNTLVKNNEVELFLKQAEFLHKNGVDALIVQDFGMICLLREMFPNLEIHASTQANISSEDICELYHNLGVKRVVFSRELDIDEIDSIKVPIEKEVFIHGALCVSYSGCCLMSSMLGGRSGNRGECAGVCRMPFTLLQGDKVLSKEKYLLSMKELNTSHQIKRLLESSINSFKIEGRMKGPLYVGFITNFYRRLLDGEKLSLEEEEKKLKTIFHREFTEGHLFKTKDEDFINNTSPNHVGLEIGRVIDITKDKVKIKLFPNCSIHQEDAIRFSQSKEGFIVNFLYDEKGLLTSDSDDVCYVDKKGNIEENDVVLKTQDYLLEKQYLEKSKKRIPISYRVTAFLGKSLKVEIQDEKNHLIEEKDVIELSKNSPIEKEDIIRQLSKLGETPFDCKTIEIEMDSNLFFPLRLLNEIRRDLTNKLMEIRKTSTKEYEKRNVTFPKVESTTFINRISCFIRNEDQLSACLGKNIRIYTDKEELYEKYRSKEDIYYKVPRNLFSYKKDSKEKELISDYRKINQKERMGDYPLNVMNIYTAYYLQKLGFSTLTLSVELTEKELKDFYHDYTEKFGIASFEILSYGRIENMIIKGNLLNLEEQKKYELIDQKGRKFPTFYDGRLTHILNWKVTELENKNWQEIYSLRLDFYEESKVEVENRLKSLEKK